MSNRKRLATALSLLLLIFGFQNCAQNTGLSTDDFESSASDVFEADNTSSGNTSSSSNTISSGSMAPPNSPPAFTIRPGSGSQTAPSQTGSTSISTTTSATCKSYVEMLRWIPNEDFKVDLLPLDNASNDGGSEIPSYSGFSISFSSTKMGTQVFNTGSDFRVSATGFAIRIDGGADGALEVPNTAYIKPETVLAKSQGSIVSWKDNNNMGSRANFYVNRDFFFSDLSRIKNARISLFCGSTLVASGIQDMRSIAVDLSKQLIRNANGTYSSKDPNTGFINISCPLEANSGATFQCTSGGTSIVSGYWLVNGKENRAFDDKSTYTMEKAAPGNYTFQRIVRYKSGIEDRSEIFLVKVR